MFPCLCFFLPMNSLDPIPRCDIAIALSHITISLYHKSPLLRISPFYRKSLHYRISPFYCKSHVLSKKTSLYHKSLLYLIAPFSHRSVIAFRNPPIPRCDIAIASSHHHITASLHISCPSPTRYRDHPLTVRLTPASNGLYCIAI